MLRRRTERAGEKRPTRDRFLGCLLGGAIGDALGYPIEFLALPDIRRRFGDAPPQNLHGWPEHLAEISDDTQMTLFTAEGILRALQRFHGRGISNAIAVVDNALLRWLATQTREGADRWVDTGRRGWLLHEPRLHAQRAPGNTCLSALQRRLTDEHLPTISEPPNASKGCGAVMRSAPLGLARCAVWSRSGADAWREKRAHPRRSNASTRSSRSTEQSAAFSLAARSTSSRVSVTPGCTRAGSCFGCLRRTPHT
jgi:ADP-ribosylglycohydrolase